MKAQLSTLGFIVCSALAFIQAMESMPRINPCYPANEYRYTISIAGISCKDFKDKVRGCVLGAALGDMLGAPTEFISSREAINKVYPPSGITGIESFKEKDFTKDASGKKVAPYTDDTAMSILVLETITCFSRSQFNPPSQWNINDAMHDLALSFVKDMNNPAGWAQQRRAPGLTCLRNVQELATRFEAMARKHNKDPRFWAVGKPTEGGCGSVMRAHPFGLIFAGNIEKAIEWAVEHSKITHGAPMALAACAAMACGVAHALRNEKPEAVAQRMYEVAKKYDSYTAQLIERAIEYAYDARKPSDEVFKEFQGWAAHEAIAAATYAFLKHPDDLKKAILLGVNTPGDSDSIASMAGALVGARIGAQQIPQEWLEVLEGSQRLIQLADNVANLYKK